MSWTAAATWRPSATGVDLHSVAGDAHALVHAAGHAAEIGPCDTVLFCVKS